MSSNPPIHFSLITVKVFHDGQVDKSGVPYINHPVRVMLRLGPGAPIEAMHAALLHDVIEDTGVQRSDLEAMGYSDDVLDIVDLVTRKPEENYRSFIYRIIGSGNRLAMRVKLADLFDNADPERAKSAPEEVRAQIEKMIQDRYKPAIAMLKQVLGSEAEVMIPDPMDVEVDIEGVLNVAQ